MEPLKCGGLIEKRMARRAGDSKTSSVNTDSEESLQGSGVVESDSSKKQVHDEDTIQDSADEDASFDGIVIARQRDSSFEREVIAVSSSLTGGTDEHDRKSERSDIDSQQKEKSSALTY